MPCPLSFSVRNNPVPIVLGDGGPQGWSGLVQKVLSPPGFDPWTIQVVASHCTE